MTVKERERADSRLLGTIVHCAFYVLLAASVLRYFLKHHDSPRAPWVFALAAVLAVLYVVSELRESRRILWFALLVGTWVVLVLLAPSFAWCAVALLYTGLRILPLRAALVLVTALTALIVIAQVKLAGWADPNLLLAPPAVAAISTALFVGMRRHTEQQAALIADLRATRRELAATERREGTLAERQRLAMEIHDTLAQGLSSQRMLLQAADRIWETDPDRARTHIRTAAAVAEQNLTEARRFVDDLAPADLAAGGSLVAALRALAEREGPIGLNAPGLSSDSPRALTVRVQVDGEPAALPGQVEAALLRIAQGALANAREHAAASTVTLTVTYLGDQVVLDIADDGTGFDPAAPVSGEQRGHGLPAMRARLRQLGGTLTVESAPGEGTVLSAVVPLAAG
ncbi:sensor histidine kinase [Nocardia yamanashiensis]|uniref:sensor histidine kinase n=1 Tax=Nocardia yamanashiensis TaxID=209247 RepID=UPI001E43201E|nr:sensor histidine kinase [Nocardia yamanashiensis]UGT38805.1 sensor histidine kinase [Nocardia yamanashiensis]